MKEADRKFECLMGGIYFDRQPHVVYFPFRNFNPPFFWGSLALQAVIELHIFLGSVNCKEFHMISLEV